MKSQSIPNLFVKTPSSSVAINLWTPMKQLVLAACVTFVSLNLGAQSAGTVVLGNDNSCLVVNGQTGNPVTAAEGIKAALYWSRTGLNTFVQIGAAVNVGVPADGLFTGGTRVATNAANGDFTAGGTSGDFRIRTWSGGAPTYEQAQSAGGNLLGESGVIAVPTGDPGGFPPTPPSLLTANGLQGFTVTTNVVAPLPCSSIVAFDLSPPGTDSAVGIRGQNEATPNVSTGSGGEISPGIYLDTATGVLTFAMGYGSSAGFTDLTGGVPTAMHFHAPAGPGTNAPVAVNLSPFNFAAVNPALGGVILGSVTLTPSQLTNILNRLFYVNIHTPNFPGGEIRAQLIPVLTNPPPVITCPASINVQCLSNVPPCPGSLAAFLDAGGTVSAYGGTNITYTCSDGPFVGGTCSGTISRTHTATDACSNSASCVQVITVRDTIPPVINCPADLNVQCLSNVPPCPANLAQFLALGGTVAFDNCDTNLNFTCSDGPLIGGPCGGRIQRFYCVTDDCTNSACCAQIITVRDTIPPVIACPTNITVTSLSNVPPCPANLAQFLALGGTVASDNCDTNLEYHCADSAPIGSPCDGTIRRTHTIIDDCTNSASCVQIITIRCTNQPPTIYCPSNIVVECSGGLTPVTYTVTAVDSSGNPLPVVCVPPSGSGFRQGTTNVTCTATDSQGQSSSCTFTVTVVDTTPPQVNCPGDITVSNAVGACSVVVTYIASASDACGIRSLDATPPSGSTFPAGTTVVTVTAVNSAGLSNSCTFNVTVLDSTPPDITCPTDIVVTNDPGQCSAVVNYEVTATDNCGGCTLLSQDFNAGDGGFTVVTPQPFDGPWVYNAATGSWGENGQGPENSHPNTSMLNSPAVNVTCAGPVQLTLVHRYSFEAGQWDGGQVRISVNGGPYTTVPAAAFTANGYNGTVLANSASVLAGQAAFVELSTNYPNGFITSVADLGVLNAGDTISVQFIAASDTNTRGQYVPNWEIDSVALAVGNGSNPVTVVCDPPSGSTFPVGTNIVCCTATDAAGNSNTCCFTVTVEDREAPLVACRQGVNPSGKKIPVAGKNPASGQNPDGFYQLLGRDNCDVNPALAIYIADTGSAFVAGPFANGDVIKLTQSPGKTPSQDPAPDPIVAHIHLKGDGLLFAVDASGNVSEPELCLVPRPPK